MGFEVLKPQPFQFVAHAALGYSVKEIALRVLGSATRSDQKAVQNCLSRSAKKLGYHTVSDMKQALLRQEAPELFDTERLYQRTQNPQGVLDLGNIAS